MENKKILVLGYFGYITNQLDGQTVKTRDLYRLFTEKCEHNIDFFDTENFQKSIFSVFTMFLKLIKCRTLIYLPAHNNLKFIFPVIYIFSLIFRFKINYFVIGGWLVPYLKNKPLHRLFLRNINGIFTETKLMKSGLEENYNIKNVVVFPNFRIHNFENEAANQAEGLRIVFMSRVHKMKGLDIIFLMAEYIQTHHLNICIDFYGPIHTEDKEYFEAEVNKYSFTNYLGILEPENIHNSLLDYDLLILPTRYYTEGFPGAILDAYISGVPVLVSKWKHATEFVDDNKTGYICSLDEPNQFIDKMTKLYNDRELLKRLKKGAKLKSAEYSSESAWQIIDKQICG